MFYGFFTYALGRKQNHQFKTKHKKQKIAKPYKAYWGVVALICSPKTFGMIKAPYAATADVQPSTGPAYSSLNTIAMVLNVEPFPTPVAVNKIINNIKNGQKYSSEVTDL